VDEGGVVTADMTPTPMPIETSTAAVSTRKARTPESSHWSAKPVARGPLLHSDSAGSTCGTSAEPRSV
jgi:hypothetical protein